MAAPAGFPVVYRGGPNLNPTMRDVKVDAATGLVQPTHGISVHADPAVIGRFGGAYLVVTIPAGLKIEQRGRDRGHYEIMPAAEMTMQEYEDLLAQIVLQPHGSP